MNRASRNRRAGFTLVEMLVVIAIIGVLVAILIPTLYRAFVRARETRILMEIDQIHSAVEAYKQKYGDYPPDMSHFALVERHINKCFPNIAPKAADPRNVQPHEELWPTQLGVYYNNPRFTFDPAEAVVFWLGGLSDDPRHPFTGAGGPLQLIRQGNNTIVVANDSRNQGQMDFDQGRLTLAMNASGLIVSNDEITLHGLQANANPPNEDALPVFYPAGLSYPYVYFDARTYGGWDNSSPLDEPSYPPAQYVANSTTTVRGVARPYLMQPPNRPARWGNEKTFQIISAGLDEDYGTDVFPQFVKEVVTKSYFSPGDNDNLTNLAGRKLEDVEQDQP